MKTTEKIYNILTNTEKIIEKELTPEQIEKNKWLENEAIRLEQERIAKNELRLALLNRLGITEEEAKLLLG